MADEFDFFQNPNTSRLVSLTLQISTELFVVSARLRALEMTLARNGTVVAGAIDTFEPTEDEQRVLDEARDNLMTHLMRIIAETGPSAHPLREQWSQSLAEVSKSREG